MSMKTSLEKDKQKRIRTYTIPTTDEKNAKGLPLTTIPTAVLFLVFSCLDQRYNRRLTLINTRFRLVGENRLAHPYLLREGYPPSYGCTSAFWTMSPRILQLHEPSGMKLLHVLERMSNRLQELSLSYGTEPHFSAICDLLPRFTKLTSLKLERCATGPQHVVRFPDTLKSIKILPVWDTMNRIDLPLLSGRGIFGCIQFPMNLQIIHLHIRTSPLIVSLTGLADLVMLQKVNISLFSYAMPMSQFRQWIHGWVNLEELDMYLDLSSDLKDQEATSFFSSSLPDQSLTPSPVLSHFGWSGRIRDPTSNITSEVAVWISSLPRLVSLGMGRLDFPLSISTIIAKCSRLTHLKLGYISGDLLSVIRLIHSPIQELHVCDLQFTHAECYDLLKSLSHLKTLQCLRLERVLGNGTTTSYPTTYCIDDPETINSWRPLTSLRKMDIDMMIHKRLFSMLPTTLPSMEEFSMCRSGFWTGDEELLVLSTWKSLRIVDLAIDLDRTSRSVFHRFWTSLPHIHSIRSWHPDKTHELKKQQYWDFYHWYVEEHQMLDMARKRANHEA